MTEERIKEMAVVCVEVYKTLGVAWGDSPFSAIDDLRKDAARYRYLRNRVPNDVLSGRGPTAGCWIDTDDEEGNLVLLTGDSADEAIDAAITKCK